MTRVVLDPSARLLRGTVAGRPLSLAEHVAVHGALPLLRKGKEQLAALDGGLRGRGGAGFPVVRKLAAALEAGGRGVVVVNATEGEPASRKDHVLVSRAPHLVLDGAQLAARATGAREVVVAVHEGSGLTQLLREAAAVRDDPVRPRLLEVPDRYVAGEASALARAASGGPGRPALRLVPTAQRGPTGRPTVVSNAESVAGLALLARLGPRFAEVGAPEEPGTLLLTVRSTGSAAVLEVPVGTPLGAALDRAEVHEASAALVGGYFGAWLPLPDALDVPLSHAGMRAAGGVFGAGMVLALGRDECGLRSTAHVLRYLAGETAGQCGPCTNGLPAMAGALESLVGGFGDTRDELLRLGRLVQGRGLCGLPDGAVSLLRSALAVFAADLDAHERQGCSRPAGQALAVPARARRGSAA